MIVEVTQTNQNEVMKKMYYGTITQITEEKDSFTLIGKEQNSVYINTPRIKYEWKIIENQEVKWETVRLNEIILEIKLKKMKNEIRKTIEEHKKTKNYYERELEKAQEENDTADALWYTAKVSITEFIIDELEDLIKEI